MIELKEYLDITEDKELVDDLYLKMHNLCEYFESYENEEGLLQSLEGWIFVEWSKCNQLVQDVNYPTNMLYYQFPNTMYELYGDVKYKNKADKIRAIIRQNSRMGLFFCDNSVFNKEGNYY